MKKVFIECQILDYLTKIEICIKIGKKKEIDYTKCQVLDMHTYTYA